MRRNAHLRTFDESVDDLRDSRGRRAADHISGYVADPARIAWRVCSEQRLLEDPHGRFEPAVRAQLHAAAARRLACLIRRLCESSDEGTRPRTDSSAVGEQRDRLGRALRRRLTRQALAGGRDCRGERSEPLRFGLLDGAVDSGVDAGEEFGACLDD